MKFHFYVRFSTQLGQTLKITGNTKELGNSNLEAAVSMQFFNSQFWHLAIDIDPAASSKIIYKYVLTYADGYQVVESGNDKEIDLSKLSVSTIHTVDTWNHVGNFENVFFTAPFQQTLLPFHPSKAKRKSSEVFSHILKVKAPLLQKNEVVCIAGNGLTLGDWNVETPVLMQKNGDWWVAKLNIPREDFPLQYKYGIYNLKETEYCTRWIFAGGEQYLARCRCIYTCIQPA
jgi:4-alpha-glucanotransferase